MEQKYDFRDTYQAVLDLYAATDVFAEIIDETTMFVEMNVLPGYNVNTFISGNNKGFCVCSYVALAKKNKQSELLEIMNELNRTLMFGGFYLQEDGTVVFRSYVSPRN